MSVTGFVQVTGSFKETRFADKFFSMILYAGLAFAGPVLYRSRPVRKHLAYANRALRQRVEEIPLLDLMQLC